MPADRNHYGYISEHHAFNRDTAWDERREQWKLSGPVVDTLNHTIVAEAPEDGHWVTVVAAAVSCG